MKKLIYIIFTFLFLLACEDVIELETPSNDTRLIIDALILIDNNEPVFNVQVKASLTSGFFETIPLTGLSAITIINLDRDGAMCGNCLFLKEKQEGSGIYEEITSIEFFTEGELIIQLNHEGRLYFARTRYVPTVPIDSLRQGTNTLFNDEEKEVVVSFTDNPNQENFYVFDFGFNEYLVTKDEFYQGQEFEFSYFYDKRLEPGTEIEISVLGADLEFHNYMDKLIEQTEDNFGVFETPAATIRGNIFDITDIDNIDFFDNVDQPDNFPLGYFAIVQKFSKKIIIE